MRASHLVIAVAVLLGAAEQATASIVTLTYNDTEAGGAGFGAPGVHQHNLVLDGIDHTITASYDAASATTTTNFRQPDANRVVLGWTGSQTRIGEAWVSSTSFMQLRFTADQSSLTYDIDGRYNVDSLDPSRPGTSVMISSLDDITLGQRLFYRQGDSGSLNAEIFIDSPIGILEGGPTGSLLMGHEYQFSILVSTAPFYSESDGGAVGSGVVALTIASDISAVPEPTSLTLFGAGALALAFVGGRRSRLLPEASKA